MSSELAIRQFVSEHNTLGYSAISNGAPRFLPHQKRFARHTPVNIGNTVPIETSQNTVFGDVPPEPTNTVETIVTKHQQDPFRQHALLYDSNFPVQEEGMPKIRSTLGASCDSRQLAASRAEERLVQRDLDQKLPRTFTQKKPLNRQVIAQQSDDVARSQLLGDNSVNVAPQQTTHWQIPNNGLLEPTLPNSPAFRDSRIQKRLEQQKAFQDRQRQQREVDNQLFRKIQQTRTHA